MPNLLAAALLASVALAPAAEGPPKGARDRHWIWTHATAIPDELTSEQSGYFSIIEGKDHKIYVGTAKYGANAYLVQFDPATRDLKVVVDAQKEIGTTATGFAAQAKFHTRNNVGPSGKIYVGTKQGYPKEGEKVTDYPGGYPMVYDPSTHSTRVYPIPIPHQGIISVTPDESRNVAYISTASDERPTESSHFMILDLDKGTYRDLVDTRHMYAFIVVDELGRAYHPMLGGQIARYDPRSDRLDRLPQTIDGQPPTAESLLAHPESHPINWDITPDRKTLYAVPLSGNQLYSYDLTTEADTLAGKSLGPIIPGASATDCRAMCIGPDGTVWAGVNATFPDGQFLHLVRYRPGVDDAPRDLGPLAIGNPDYKVMTGDDGKDRPHHHGVYRLEDGTMLPRYVVMGICAATDGTVYVTTLYPFTLHAIRIPKVAGITTEYRHNAHADVILSRLAETDSLDGKGVRPPVDLVSLYSDQHPAGDMTARIAGESGARAFDTVEGALTLGGDRLAVDGVFLVAEHGDYPRNATGSIIYPKRRLFQQVLDVFDKSGRVVPVFFDKHYADNWADAKWLYDEAKRRNIPLIAGSSVPGLWRYPPADTRRGEKLKEIVVLSYGPLDAYGFHAFEVLQSLAERRAGGETGIKSVRCLQGPAVWEAGRQGLYDRALLDDALARLKQRPVPPGTDLEKTVAEPLVYLIEYRDGLRASVFWFEPLVNEWSAAWRYEAGGEPESTLFVTQEARPFSHFNLLLMAAERNLMTGVPPWPAERTLLTSGLLDAALTARAGGDATLETPWLDVSYTSDWNWTEPPPPFADRPMDGQ